MTVASGEYVLLGDGSQVLIRPLEPGDRPAVVALFGRLSEESLHLRFHGGARVDERTLALVTAGHALVAERAGRLVALASYARLRDPSRAELGIVVDDAEHGRGIGTALFERLARDAQREGVRQLVALVLAANRGMLDLLTGLGFHLTRAVDRDTIEVDVELRAGPAYLERSDARMHAAATASLAPILQARSVAVVGASRQLGSIGRALFSNLLAGGFGGVVYPVNPAATAVAAVRAYPTVSAIGERVDLAVVAVPATAVLAAARDCLEAGVRGLVVISAGFAEAGEEGRRRQEELLRLCRARGARLVGPNCMGVLVNGAGGTMNATFAPTLPPPGTVAIASQSGALGIAILDQARQLGIGVSAFLSMGNKADVSSNDLLECWETDPTTAVIVLYLESFGNPRRFARVARRVGRRKPIVAVKGGRSPAGQRAARSHTAALAGSEAAVDALFRQAGVLRCDTLEELFDATALLANQPLPAGRRAAIVTNAGGLGILCSDACASAGLELPELAPSTQMALRAMLPPEAAVANPVDLLASAAAGQYGDALHLVLTDPNIDTAIVLFIPPMVTQAEEVAAALVAACTPAPAKPVLTCFVGVQGVPVALRGATALPSYRFPEAAARALGHAAERAAWLRRPAGRIPTFADVEAEAARAVVDRALGREERPWLDTADVRTVLRAYGIAMPDGRLAHSPEEAADACRTLGGPVVVKLISSTVLHKSDVAGVYLGIGTPEAAAPAYRAIEASLAARGMSDAMAGALVQPMVTGGVECLVGVATDPTFGPLIAFGLGGLLAEVVGDIAFRLHPLTDVDAEELIAATKAAAVLRGYRGAPPSDIPALRELLLRLSRLVEDIPELIELDLNPVVVRAAWQGAVALDARLRLGRPA